ASGLSRSRREDWRSAMRDIELLGRALHQVKAVAHAVEPRVVLLLGTRLCGRGRIRTCVGYAGDFTDRSLWPLGHPPASEPRIASALAQAAWSGRQRSRTWVEYPRAWPRSRSPSTWSPRLTSRRSGTPSTRPTGRSRRASTSRTPARR